jgi:hypothetical protein
MENARSEAHPDAMNDLADDLARLLAKEHDRLTDERGKRLLAEETASELAILLVREQHALEREREARRQAEQQAQELSTLILGDAPPQRPGARFVPQRTPLRSVS